MKHLILSLKSRDEIYKFMSLLKSKGIPASIVSAPKSIGSSCMLAIKIDFKFLSLLINIINSTRPRTFLGLYLFSQTVNGYQTSKLM